MAKHVKKLPAIGKTTKVGGEHTIRVTNRSGTTHRSATSGRYVEVSAPPRHPANPTTTDSEPSGQATPTRTVDDDADAFNASLPAEVDEGTIQRLVAEAEDGIAEEKLRRRGRGRPSIGEDAASTYSVRLPDDLVTLADERSSMDGVSRGETIRRALIEYLTK